MRSFAFVATLLASPLFVSAKPTPRSPFNQLATPELVVYWGGGTNQKPLADFCDDDTIDVIPIGFVNKFPGQDGTFGLPGTNFANACLATEYFYDAQGHKTSIFSPCANIVRDMAICQQKGKKILISIGGDSPGNQLASKDAATSFAQQLWEIFGPKPAGFTGPRPFGDNVVDGFDFDIESGDGSFIPNLAASLSALSASDKSKKYLLTAAPQCNIPDVRLSEALKAAPFDKVFVQFYNNPGCAASSSGFNFNSWAQWLSTNSKNKAISLYLGLPASPDAVPSFPGHYLSVDDASKLVESLMCANQYKSMFGGVMLWEATFSENNQQNGKSYAENIKDAMKKCSCFPHPVTSTTTTTSSTTTTTTTTSSTTTTTPYVHPTTTTTSTTTPYVHPTTSTTTPYVHPTTTTTSTTTPYVHPTTSTTTPYVHPTTTTTSTTTPYVHPTTTTTPYVHPTTTTTSTTTPYVHPTTTTTSTTTPYVHPTTSSTTTPTVPTTTSTTRPYVHPTTYTTTTPAVPTTTSSATLPPYTSTTSSSSTPAESTNTEHPWEDWSSSSVPADSTTSSSPVKITSTSTSSTPVVVTSTTTSSFKHPWEDWSSTTSSSSDPVNDATTSSTPAASTTTSSEPWKDWESTSSTPAASFTPLPATTPAWSDWQSTSTSSSPAAVTSSSVSSWVDWAPSSTLASVVTEGAGSNLVSSPVSPATNKPVSPVEGTPASSSVPVAPAVFTGAAPAEELPSTVLSVAICVAVAVVGLFV